MKENCNRKALLMSQGLAALQELLYLGSHHNWSSTLTRPSGSCKLCRFAINYHKYISYLSWWILDSDWPKQLSCFPEVPRKEMSGLTDKKSNKWSNNQKLFIHSVMVWLGLNLVHAEHWRVWRDLTIVEYSVGTNWYMISLIYLVKVLVAQDKPQQVSIIGLCTKHYGTPWHLFLPTGPTGIAATSCQQVLHCSEMNLGSALPQMTIMYDGIEGTDHSWPCCEETHWHYSWPHVVGNHRGWLQVTPVMHGTTSVTSCIRMSYLA